MLIPRTSILLCLLSGLVANAYPSETTNAQEQSLDRRYVEAKVRQADPTMNIGPDSDNYPGNDDIKAQLSDPGDGKYVFYAATNGSTIPAKFADSIGGKIMRQALHNQSYLNLNGRGSKWYGKFIDRAAGIYADNAHGEVFFVSNWTSQGLVEDCRTWNRVELPTLLKNKHVTKITLVNYQDFSQTMVLPKKSTQRTNAQFKGFCNDYEGYNPDPAIPGHEDYRRYKKGWCGIHWTQYQKNEGPGDMTKYRFDVKVFDHEGLFLGGVYQAAVPSNRTLGVPSVLHKAVTVSPGALDGDAVTFGYSNKTWTTNEWGCKTGGYDNGIRQGDCGFTCA